MVGTEVKTPRLQFIAPGSTDRDQVIAELGPPESIFEDIRVLAYSWETRVGYFMMIYPLLGGTEIGQSHVLLIQLDETNQVNRFEILKRGTSDSVRSTAVAWAKKGGSPAALQLPTRFVPVSIPPGKSLIHLYRSGGFQVPGVGVRIVLDTQTIADLRSGECFSMVLDAGSHSIGLQAHSLFSAVGSFTVASVGNSIWVNASANEACYIRVTVPAGHGVMEPHAKIVPETEATAALKKLKPW